MLVVKTAKADEDPFHIETARHKAHVSAKGLPRLVELIDLLLYFFNNLIDNPKIKFVYSWVAKYRFRLLVQGGLLFYRR